MRPVKQRWLREQLTDEYPRTREQAVSYLAERGVEAHLSPWSGGSIAVVSHPDRTGTIPVWKRSVHITGSSDRWVLHKSRHRIFTQVETSSLREACELAILALRDWI